MKYVLDASIGIKWVIVEPDSNKATRLCEDYRNAIHELIAAESFTIECAYSLTKKQRQKLVPDARALWDDTMVDAPLFIPILSLMDRALDISIQALAPEDRHVGERLVQDVPARRAQPTVEKGRVDLAEVDCVFRVAVFHVLE